MKERSQSPAANKQLLAELAGQIAQTDGVFNTLIPELTVFRRSTVTAPIPCIYGLGLGLTVQGGKRVMLGDEMFDYGPGQSLLTSVDLPVISHVTRASAEAPYLGLGIALDARLITQIAAGMPVPAPSRIPAARAMSVVDLEDGLLGALVRLVQLLQEPAMIPLIAPLMLQEIIVRLLSGGHERVLRHLVTVGSPGQQIAKVMTWLKQHYMEDIAMEDLSVRAHMSPSTFRQHFRQVAGMSPLQYLKYLRLQEARQLMLNQDLDASSAAIQVGYESASQFSREYTRLFGAPPLRDIRRVRALPV